MMLTKEAALAKLEQAKHALETVAREFEEPEPIAEVILMLASDARDCCNFVAVYGGQNLREEDPLAYDDYDQT